MRGALFAGSRACQSAAVRPAAAMASTSDATASVTTSASSPLMTARASTPEAPLVCVMVTSWPLFAFQYFAKAALYAW